MNTDNGFTLIEVLVATVLVGLMVGSVVVGSVNLSRVNARAQVQSLEATAARAVALRYASSPAPGGTRQGNVNTLIALQDLTPAEQDLIQHFTYTIREQTTQRTLTITRSDLNPDPYPLTITAQLE